MCVGWRGRRRRGAISRTASTTTLSRATMARSTRRGSAPRPQPITCCTCRPAASSGCGCAWRPAEADEFYAALQEAIADPDARLVHRQAFAGMLWTKQFYYFDIPEWLA